MLLLLPLPNAAHLLLSLRAAHFLLLAHPAHAHLPQAHICAAVVLLLLFALLLLL